MYWSSGKSYIRLMNEETLITEISSVVQTNIMK